MIENKRDKIMRDTLTCSSLKTFRNCRKNYYLRHEKCLTSAEESVAQYLGSIIHSALEKLYTGRNNEIANDIQAAFPGRDMNDKQRHDWHLAKAMIGGYINHYANESLSVIAVEKEFSAPIINPETGAASRTFIMRGKVDAIVEIDGENFIMEHKTASSIDSGYIERLPMDWQTMLYAHYIEQSTGLKITGILYNVIAKSKIRRGMGETAEEFEARRARLIAKSKTGKSTAKQKVAETDGDFEARLALEYNNPNMYHREKLYLRADLMETLVVEIWELTQQILLSRRSGNWYRNTDVCFNYNRPCRYWPICSSNDSQIVIDSLYKIGESHPELNESSVEQGKLFAEGVL